MINLDNCKKGNHSLIALSSTDMGYNVDKVVRWCKICGAIVIDGDSDGRTRAGYYREMELSKLFLDKFNNKGE